MENTSILVTQKCFELDRKNLSKLKSSFVKNFRCLVPSDGVAKYKKVTLQSNINCNTICCGDTVLVELTYYDNEKEQLQITLFDCECDFLNDEVSISSPLGEAIYNKNVGDKTSYMIKDNSVKVNILKKVAN